MTSFEKLLSNKPDGQETVAFEPSRRAGLARLEHFLSRTGGHYTAQRNYDLGPFDRSTVSALSPWIRHRLITEYEVLQHTLAHHNAKASIAFLQEVFWRGYFKGWLEQHPSVWGGYQSGLLAAQNRLHGNIHFKSDYESAIDSRTGIDCFDHWCRELKQTGYLHNHARMWFASIWIFTLRLPWELGAQFFLDHLLDGDPAPNTLSWRWVGGLHTKGKTYLARADNIVKFTKGAFNPQGQLALAAEPLVEEGDHPLIPFSPNPPLEQNDYLLLVTAEDCHPQSTVVGSAAGVLGLVQPRAASQSALPYCFQRGAVEEALTRFEAQAGLICQEEWIDPIMAAAEQVGTRRVVTAFAPVGPVADQLQSAKAMLAAQGIELYQHQRRYDHVIWPHATKGFFKLKKMIPQILAELDLVAFETP